MPDTFVRTRCGQCEKILSFEDFAHGGSRCAGCVTRAGAGQQFVRGPQREAVIGGHPTDEAEYERLLDSIPEELVDELVAVLEAEAVRRASSPMSPVAEVFEELGIGRSARDLSWAAWGFALGFGANVALAKYAQMASGAPMREFIAPLLVGGLLAGVCCAAIAWGLSKLRETPQASAHR